LVPEDLERPAFHNKLLQSLPDADVALLMPHLTAVTLANRQELERPNKPIKDVFFPESGIVSVVSNGARKKQIEIGIIGREGMTGVVVVMGDDRSPRVTYVQVLGHGFRIAADELRRAMGESATLRNALLHFAQTFMTQAMQTAISNGSAKLEERLARWLLMAHDRVDGDELPLIHEFLALMLGVRRPGVTIAIHSLEAQGLISNKRSNITIIDREGLEEVANASYGIPEAEYERLMKTPLRRD
jgi:CRP-like cAMP-binding protein